jgi:hypothetical protein
MSDVLFSVPAWTTSRGGGGQNTIYSNGADDVLDDGPSNDMIYANGWDPGVQDPEGFASDQICHPTYNGSYGDYDPSVLTTVADPSAFYGSYCYYAPPDPNNLSDPSNRVFTVGLAGYLGGCERLAGMMQRRKRCQEPLLTGEEAFR